MTKTLDFPAAPDWPWLKAQFSGSGLLHADCSLPAAAARLRGVLAYLATPYTKQVCDADGRWNPYFSKSVALATARWALNCGCTGVTVTSPILISCEMVRVDRDCLLDPLDEKFWQQWCQPMLAASAAVVVPPMVGWDRSGGVWFEVCWALRHNRPVYLIAGSAGEVAA